MENKLNIEALKAYSKAYSEKILTEIFSKREFASGEVILKLSEVRQVNLFIIFQLFSSWKEEIDRLESPYFDYRHKEVRKAMKEFVNVLSKHIQISKEHLNPLVEKAVEDTLFLVLSPYDFYCNKIENWGKPNISLKDLNAFSKYVKINHNLMSAFVSKLEARKENDILIEEAIKMLNEVFAETTQTPEDIEAYVAKFSTVIPLDVNKIYGEKSIGKSTIGPQEKQNIKNEANFTLNDQLAKKEEQTTLAELHKKKKIDNIKSNLSINQKFMFVNQLFDGNAEDFNQVIDFLDNCPSQAEAMDFINKNYLKKSSWKKDSMEVKEFIEVIAKKYGSDMVF